jgi:hypothetical protein
VHNLDDVPLAEHGAGVVGARYDLEVLFDGDRTAIEAEVRDEIAYRHSGGEFA